MDIQILTDEGSIQQTIESFLKLVEEVPWGNSDWQNKNAVVNSELTPERAYRHASLRIMNRLQALNECYYTLKKDNLLIKKYKTQILKEDNEIERELLQLEVDKLLSNRPYTQKLVIDAIKEIESLSPIIQSIGKLTRDKFEAAEDQHFKVRYENLLTKNEALLGLEQMGVDINNGAYIKGFKTLYDSITDTNLIGE